jgi:hypothetical protein
MHWREITGLTLSAARSLSPGRAPAVLAKAAEANPSAKGVRDLCSVIGKTDAACVDTFFKDAAIGSYITKQATINCMSQIAASQAQTDALLAAINIDPSEMAKYAEMAPHYWVRLNSGDLVIKNRSPSDLERASQAARKSWHDNAELVEKYVTLFTGTLGARFGGRGSFVAGAATIFAFGPSWADKWGDFGAVDGYRHPETYLDSYMAPARILLRHAKTKQRKRTIGTLITRSPSLEWREKRSTRICLKEVTELDTPPH